MIRQGSSKCPTILDNDYCPYCGQLIQTNAKTLEHFIGRKMVPYASLENCWNLQLNACRKCNNKKSNFEDDISAITQLYYYHNHNNGEKNELLRKKLNNSISRRTNKIIKDSDEKICIRMKMNDKVKISFSKSGPPQIDSQRASELAVYYCQAFFL